MSEKDARVAVIGLGKKGLLHASILSTLLHVHLVTCALDTLNSLSRRLVDIGEFFAQKVNTMS